MRVVWRSEGGRGRKIEEKADSSKDLNKKLKVFWLVASALELTGSGSRKGGGVGKLKKRQNPVKILIRN